MKRQSIRRARRGFTLIELLVVVVIIGILAAIAVPIYLNQRRAAWKAAAVSDASSAALSMETARAQNGGTLDGVSIVDGSDGKPMTIAVGAGTATTPTSPGDSLSAWTGTDPTGAECYAIVATNSNLPGWAAVRTSTGLTTGTPPANGSADCPKPTAKPATATITLNAYVNGADQNATPFRLAISLSGTTATVHALTAGTPTGAAGAATVVPDATSPLAISSVAGATVDGGTTPSIDWWAPNPLILGLQTGGTITITTTGDPSSWTAAYTA